MPAFLLLLVFSLRALHTHRRVITFREIEANRVKEYAMYVIKADGTESKLEEVSPFTLIGFFFFFFFSKPIIFFSLMC